MLALDSVMFSAWKREPTNTPEAGFTAINVSNAVQMAATRAVVRVGVTRATHFLTASVTTPNTFAASIIVYLRFICRGPLLPLVASVVTKHALNGRD